MAIAGKIVGRHVRMLSAFARGTPVIQDKKAIGADTPVIKVLIREKHAAGKPDRT
jgi:hypothetical protein